MKKEVKVNDEELKRRKKSMKALKTCMIVLDVTFSVKVENSPDIKLNKKTSKKK